MTIYKCGSSVNPYINNPHDADYIALLSDEESVAVELPTTYADGHLMCCKLSKYIKQMPLWGYLFHWYVLIEGEDMPLPDFLERKTEWLENVRKRLFEADGERIAAFDYFGKFRKILYHIIMGLYIIKNGSYELTDEQAANVQAAHDGNASEAVLEWMYTTAQTIT